MKFFAQICVILAIIAAASSASATWGERNITDVAIITKNVFYSASRNAQTVYFDIPASYQSNNKVISAIYLQDQFRNSSGPTNSLVYGGPGWTFASIQMRTQAGIGLNVTYIIYGKIV